ncbi:MAG TPA: PhnA domain-containing protein [Cellvibrionaceae bacterium]
MPIDATLTARSHGQCELCGATSDTHLYQVPAADDQDGRVLLCDICLGQIEAPTDDNHLRCLTTSLWSQVAAIQVLSWRLLKQLADRTWAQEQLDIAYLEEDILAWAQAGLPTVDEHALVHKDCNGVVLQAGDTVTIIKDLDVKGTSFTAKRGTAVRGISLTDNSEHIEGRVNGTRIVILTQFVKKS